MKLDDITYEIKKDDFFPVAENKKTQFYIKAGFPYCYVTQSMSYHQVQKVAKCMRDLGFTVVENI